MLQLLLLFYHLDVAIPSTHWLITESGKVEAQPDSIFMIRQPNDFVAFIHQEQRFIDMNDLHEKLSEFRGRLDDNTSLNVPDVESSLSKDDPDCIFAGRSLTQFDLYLSTLSPVSDPKSFKIVSIDSSTKLKEPVCTDVDIGAVPEVDNFPRLRERGFLVMQEETGLMPTLLLDGKIRLSQYGHSVSALITKEQTNWKIFNLATLYWRMKGDALEAVECIRRAIHFSSKIKTHSVSLVNLGNILHQSLKTAEAAVALDIAVKADPDNAVAHYTLANVFAVLMKYNSSIQHFDTALRLKSDLDWVKKRSAAVKCHQKLELALEDQHSRLQDTLEQLKTYQSQHSTWSSMNNKLHSIQAPLESRVASRDSYESFKIETEGVRFRPQGCYENIVNGQNVLECVTIHYKNDNPVHSVFRRTHHVSSVTGYRTGSDPDEVFKMYAEVSEANEALPVGPDNLPEHLETPDNNKPSKKKRYPKLGNYNEFTNYNKASWPGKDECKTYVTRYPEWTQLPSVYLPPDNKGFDLKRMISDDIDLAPKTPHPLPWYPPLCDSDKFEKLKLPPRYANLPGFFTTPTKEKLPDESIKPRFLVSFGRVEMNENIAELGARIKTVMDGEKWPAWLLNILAATYWRILGNTGASVTCYGLALSEVPTQYKDLVLTNLGSLLYKLGHVDAAMKLLQESLAICDTEPETHFFLANLLAAKGNMTGSIDHYRSALMLEPDYPGGVEQLRIPSCYVKYHLVSPDTGSCSAPGHGSSCSDSREQYEEIQGNKDFILCKDGHCQFVSQEEIEKTKETLYVHKATNEFAPNDREVFIAKSDPDEKVNHITISSKPREPILRGHIEAGAYEDFKEKNDVRKVEIANVAITEDNEDYALKFALSPIIVDDAIPEILFQPRVNKEFVVSDAMCSSVVPPDKSINRFTSTWISVAIKGINFPDMLPDERMIPADLGNVEPLCPPPQPSLKTLDHLGGMMGRPHLRYVAEYGLTNAFLSLDPNNKHQSIEKLARRVATAIAYDRNNWALSTAASLYWRVKGDHVNAVNCIRHALAHAPNHHRDTALISLANVYHRSGLYNDAIIVTNLALEISPQYVVSHFTMAIIYESRGDLEMAKLFYRSTLELQSTFEPATKRLARILCQEKQEKIDKKKSKKKQN